MHKNYMMWKYLWFLLVTNYIISNVIVIGDQGKCYSQLEVSENKDVIFLQLKFTDHSLDSTPGPCLCLFKLPSQRAIVYVAYK